MAELAVAQRRTRAILVALWIAATVALAASLSPGLRDYTGFALVGGLAYLASLVLFLARNAPPGIRAPLSGESPLLHGIGFLPMLGFTLAVSLLLIGLSQTVGPAVALLAPSALLALWLTVVRRRRITVRKVLWGLIAGLVTGGSIRFFRGGDAAWAIFNGITTPVLFVGGALLRDETGFGQVGVLQGARWAVVGSFLVGCLLSVPPALLNLLGGVQALDTWVTGWWHPLTALAAGVGEEVWARLFLTTFLYAMLGPTTTDQPVRAVVIAIVLGAIIHGAAHSGLNPAAILVGSLLYGVPPALLYITRDLESAIGFHFFIDLVRFAAALWSR